MDIFLHIPKTGGTSLRTATRWVYGWRGVYTSSKEEFDPEDVASSIENPSDIRLVRGHLAYGLHEHIAGKCRYFTMLRDPVSRVISLYYYIKHGWPDSEAAGLSLAEYIESDHHAYKWNEQTQQLAGPPFADERTQGEEALFRRAKRNLASKNLAFGITERFDESLLLLKRQLGWSLDPLYVRSNTTRKRPSKEEVDPDVRARIREQNQLDLRIYDHVQQRTEEMILADPILDEELTRFESKVAALSTVRTPLVNLYRILRPILSVI